MTNKKGYSRAMSIIIAVAMIFSVMVFMPEDVSAASKKPGKVNAKATKTNQMITVTWKKTKKAKKYQIYLKKGKKKWKKVATVKADGKAKQTYSIKRLNWNTTYQVKMRAVNGKKKGKWSTTYKGKLAKKTTLQAEVNKNPSAQKMLNESVTDLGDFTMTTSVSGNTVIYTFKIKNANPFSKAKLDSIFNSAEMNNTMKSVITEMENGTGIFGIEVLAKVNNSSGTQVASYSYK